MTMCRVLLTVLVAALCTGCIQIRESLVLEKDGSGTCHTQVSFPQFGLRWLPGKPNASWLKSNLPEGVKLTSFDSEKGKIEIIGQDGKRQSLPSESYDVRLSFDNLTSLNSLRVGPDTRNVMAAAAGATPGTLPSRASMKQIERAPEIGPFQKISFVQKDGLIKFRRLVQAQRSPEEAAAAEMNTPGSSAKPQLANLENAVFVISIECPGSVVSHNAMEVEGRVLTWRFNLKELQAHQDKDWTVEFTCRVEDAK